MISFYYERDRLVASSPRLADRSYYANRRGPGGLVHRVATQDFGGLVSISLELAVELSFDTSLLHSLGIALSNISGLTEEFSWFMMVRALASLTFPSPLICEID